MTPMARFSESKFHIGHDVGKIFLKCISIGEQQIASGPDCPAFAMVCLALACLEIRSGTATLSGCSASRQQTTKVSKNAYQQNEYFSYGN
jgi:hypothetical protein